MPILSTQGCVQSFNSIVNIDIGYENNNNNDDDDDGDDDDNNNSNKNDDKNKVDVQFPHILVWKPHT